MRREIDPKRLRDLAKLLDSLRELHEQLLTAVRSRIEAMRRADIPAMQTLAKQEHALAQRAQQREGLRRQLMDKIGEECGLSSRAARALTVSQLAARAPASERPMLEQAATRLRDIVAKVAQANRLAAMISREVLNHLGWVLASVRPAAGTPVVYSGSGQHLPAGDARIFETVG